jgi:hypothetical protein
MVEATKLTISDIQSTEKFLADNGIAFKVNNYPLTLFY